MQISIFLKEEKLVIFAVKFRFSFSLFRGTKIKF